MIQTLKIDNFTLYHITLVNPGQFHVVFKDGNGFTAWGVRINTPATARNTDGIDPSGSTNVTIKDSYVSTGDDGIAIKGGSKASSNITIENNHFYGTHGISIGSETMAGVSNILVRNNTISGTDSFGNTSKEAWGIRIKSSPENGGKVSKVTYLNTCITDAMGPVIFDTNYSNGKGSYAPYFTGITVNGLTAVKTQSGGRSSFAGLDAAHPLGVTLQNVQLDSTANVAKNASINASGTNLRFSGPGVNVSAFTGSGSAPTCSFPTFPKG